MGELEDLWLLARDAGCGFTVRLKELITDRRAGKSVLNVPEGPSLAAAGVGRARRKLSAVRGVNSEGKMLAFQVSDLPEMPKGRATRFSTFRPRRPRNAGRC